MTETVLVGTKMVTKAFVTAGKAIFTIEPPASFVAETNGKPHYTYRVKFVKGKEKKDKKGEFWPDAFFIALLTGPENTAHYTYMGKVMENGFVKVTPNSHFQEGELCVRIARRVLARIWANEGHLIEAAGWKVHHEGRCGRCGRLLTVPESIENGIGPECIKKM